MKRPRRRLSVSTFPFLAVLLCAMGSLILLLLVIDRRAKAVARAMGLQAAQKLAVAHGQSERQKSESAGRAQRLLADLQALRVRTSDARLQLGREEDRARTAHEITKKAGQGLAAAEELLAEEETKYANRVSQDRLANERLTARLRELERLVDRAERARRDAATTFSIVPYRGRLGDPRRPVYLECRGASVIFQPDQTSFFSDALSTSALSAEVLKRTPPTADRAKPYLLLLVRPDAVPAYYRLIGVLRNLPIDYGYELVDADWKLDFSATQARETQTGQQEVAGPEAFTRPNATNPHAAPFTDDGPISARLHSPNQPARVPGPNVADGGTLANPGFAGAPSGGHSGADIGLSQGVPSGLPLFALNRSRSVVDEGGATGVGAGQAMPGGIASGPTPASAGASEQVSTQGKMFPTGNSTGATASRSTVGESPTGVRGGQGMPGGSASIPTWARSAAAAHSDQVATQGKMFPTGNSTDTPASRSTVGQSATGAVGGEGMSGGTARIPTWAPPSSAAGSEQVPPQGAMDPPGNGAGTPAPHATRTDQSLDRQSSGDLAGTSEAPRSPGSPSQPLGSTDQTGSPSVGPYASGPQSAGSTSWGTNGGGAARHKAAAMPSYSIFRRDHVIMIDCLADRIVVSPGAVNYDLESLSTSRSGEVKKTVLRQIARWTSAVPAGETPPRIEIHFRVRPDGLRAYYVAYPLLEDLRLPVLRENVEEGIR